ncbi:C2 family cysteine protease [Synechococcus sp. RS9916]|uniref:C2 family cysteine protease n=1 Tax=Synechococcus sp. RS9916 TaxID=221359 RepID=UPI0000E54841|nr:C2 family cysteine protease [Synechococcus sp. RS9916]EAU72638.1 hypothetical protein RS9916_38921 [Synechococcus sp. RS9916]
MLEFNLDGKLNNNFDAGNAYQRVAGSEATSYGLGQSNDPLTPGAINPLTEDTLISPWEDAGQPSNAEGIKRNGALPQGHNDPATQRGVNPTSTSGDHNDNDAFSSAAQQGQRLAQRLSETAPIDQLTGGHQDGSAISSAQQTALADLLQLDQANPADLNTSPQQLDPLTGETQAGSFGFMPLPEITAFDADLLSYLGERAEVSNLLAEERFDRDQSAGTETHYNFTWGSGFSANEGSGYDITDSRTNAADIGTVAYRDDKEVIGTIGYGSGSNRDYNDYFSFYAGKSGTYDLSLSNLGANVGLALYNDSGSLVTWSNKSGTQDENISTFLNEGHYTSRIYSYNTSFWNNNGATAFNLDISRQADCFEQITNCLINDNSVKNAVLNSIKYDNLFDRNDTVGILKSAGDYGSVTNTELTDLQQFHNIFSGTMRADIAGLSKKVVFGDASNAWYTGYDSIRNELGNLEAGTSTQNLNLLIGKHMLGTDRPMIHTGSYTQAGGSLFVDGIDAGDIDQGATGSCYFLSALAGTADKKESIIEDMFTDNGDGTYSVRFYTNGQTDYVTVDSMMATRADGTYLHADAGDGTATNALVADNNELWVALAEKAYAQLNESGRLNQEEATNRYGIAGNEGISWGFTTDAITHITGLNSSWGNASASGVGATNVSSSELQTLVNSNRVVAAGWGGHARTITGYNATTGQYTIRNPYDRNHSTLTHAQLISLGAQFSWSNS